MVDIDEDRRRGKGSGLSGDTACCGNAESKHDVRLSNVHRDAIPASDLP